MTTECNADARTTNPIDARIGSLMSDVSSWSALFVGALAVALSHEVAEALPLSEFHRALALFPVTLALLYGLLWLAVALEGRSR
ncbi:hypothetical protein [Halobacterium litoreum]|uniref:Uncharacterized protein n=1 Tax=Halobacterium litoreum TaxID=2039234 RepID=A0ABD5NI81_9EURY|nr:hypothetical protein [Halobacterium litoreum]UHH12576.1 hypothetical protein LT972_10455 [Halobacterium litoreum]